jgi:GNAT superfamily N-acetyltransferase
LRKAQPDEAPLLSAIAMESKAHWGYTPGDMARWADELSIPAQDVDTGHLWVAETEEGIAGFYKLRLDGTCAELEHLWIRPSLMHRGIGRRLLRHALLAAEAAGVNVLQVVADPNAAGFYEGEGGTVRGAVSAPLSGNPDRALPVYEFQVHSANRN